jgi:hypothetical protein
VFDNISIIGDIRFERGDGYDECTEKNCVDCRPLELAAAVKHKKMSSSTHQPMSWKNECETGTGIVSQPTQIAYSTRETSVAFRKSFTGNRKMIN